MNASARAIVLTALLSAPAARAAEPATAALDLTWSAPAECPMRDDVMREVERILGGGAPRRARARADVMKLGAERWQVRLVTEVDGAAGERAIEASTCEQLASATALILAWVLDPSRAHDGETPAAPPSRPAAAPAEPV